MATTIRINIVITGIEVDEGKGVEIRIDGKGIEVPLEGSKLDLPMLMRAPTPIIRLMPRSI